MSRYASRGYRFLCAACDFVARRFHRRNRVETWEEFSGFRFPAKTEMLETRVLLSITPSLTGANTATFTGDGAVDTLYFQLQSGLLAYSTTGAGGSYTTDLDPAGGTQTLTWSGATVITANLNAGNDAVTIDDALSATMQSTGGKINIAGAAGTLAISSPNALAITGIITNTGAINISALQSIFVLTGASLTSSGGDVNLTTTRSSTSNTASLTQQILVTSATVSGVNVNMTVSSTINATDQDPLNALGSELSLIDVDSTAEVSIAGRFGDYGDGRGDIVGDIERDDDIDGAGEIVGEHGD